MITVADFIVKRQRELGIANRELATAAGYESYNVITMIRKGRTRLPLDKVHRFAEVLQVDPAWLFRLALKEYMPETLSVIETCLGPLVTNNERCLLEVWRHATRRSDPELSAELREGFMKILKLGISIAPS